MKVDAEFLAKHPKVKTTKCLLRRRRRISVRYLRGDEKFLAHKLQLLDAVLQLMEWLKGERKSLARSLARVRLDIAAAR